MGYSGIDLSYYTEQIDYPSHGITFAKGAWFFRNGAVTNFVRRSYLHLIGFIIKNCFLAY